MIKNTIDTIKLYELVSRQKQGDTLKLEYEYDKKRQVIVFIGTILRQGKEMTVMTLNEYDNDWTKTPYIVKKAELELTKTGIKTTELQTI